MNFKNIKLKSSMKNKFLKAGAVSLTAAVMAFKKRIFQVFFFLGLSNIVIAQQPSNNYRYPERTYLDSKDVHGGEFNWLMMKAGDVNASGESVSQPDFDASNWLPAIVPGTVLNSLVYNNLYPDPYFGMNNKLESGLIPDIYNTGRDFYTYWFRTGFEIPDSYNGKQIWMYIGGVNYRAEIWVNGNLLCAVAGMFRDEHVNITEFVTAGNKNTLAVKVYPVDMPGTVRRHKVGWQAQDHFENGGDGNIGLNTTMLMSVGWDFTLIDGIRDRNTGIWRSISIYATGQAVVRHPFVKTELSNNYTSAATTVSVELTNATNRWGDATRITVTGEIVGTGIKFSKDVTCLRQMTAEVLFTPEEFPQLNIQNPRLWWPLNKGPQNLYELKMTVAVNGVASDSIKSRFGIREITSDLNTPDKSRQFYVNGKPVFIRGTNWIPEAMLKSNDERTYAELRYTKQSGSNLIRFWGGGIDESEYFYQLCDEMGFLVWLEFFMTGDTKHPQDKGLYLNNVESVVKRLRNHPSLAYYVSSNESTEMPGTEELVNRIDGTRGYQMQSECCGVHDGSPYKPVNPMRYYENTASDRGSRIDGFNPEYGAPTLPLVEHLREFMDEKDLWPINKEAWNYRNGNGFYEMATVYKQLTDMYGSSSSIDEFAAKAQFVGAMSYKAIWESWNRNKLHYGDRYCAGLLFWYLQSPVPQLSGGMWDHSLEPTASLYHTQNAMEPLHPQFDYLKNTVSVVNDYYRSFEGYRVTAEVYDIRSRKVWEKSATFNIPEDGVVNDIFTVDFPADISKVHFIKLRLFDERGKQAGSNFYWRSTDNYEGKETMTGPATSGFESLAELPEVRLSTKFTTRETNGLFFTDVEVKNSSKTIAFFTQLQFLDTEDKPVRPSFYTDNFFSLLPGESRMVTIETAKNRLTKNKLVVKGWNVQKQMLYVN